MGALFGPLPRICFSLLLTLLGATLSQSWAAGGQAKGQSVSPVVFEELGPASGVDFVLRNSATPRKYQIEPMIAGVALFDYDNDGYLDIYLVNGAEIPALEKTGPLYFNRLYRNQGNGTFRDVTLAAGVQGQGYSMAAGAADYDNDGWQDLYVAGVNRNQLFRNNGDGTFSDVAAKAGVAGIHPQFGKTWAVAAGWFDYDNDGRLDLFVANYVVWDFDKDPFCGWEHTQVRIYCHPSYFEPLPNFLYRNNGDGTFTDVSAESGIGRYAGKGMGVAFADYDDDGDLDVFVANDKARSLLFRNDGKGVFTERAIPAGVAYNGDGRMLSCMGVDFRDIDNDGRPDLFITALTNETFPYYHNEGGGIFDDFTRRSELARLSITMSGWSNGIYDLNNDGWKDLFSVNSYIEDIDHIITNYPYRQRNAVFANRGGRFVDHSGGAGAGFQTAGAHRGCAFGDLDNDGRVDVVATRFDEPARIFRNVSPASQHWLLVELVGTRSNRDGIGAKLVLESAGGVQHNHVTTSVGYGGSSDRRVHFGLGPDESVKRLEIRWPSGIRQQLRDVPANQVLRVEEPIPANARPEARTRRP